MFKPSTVVCRIHQSVFVIVSLPLSVLNPVSLSGPEAPEDPLVSPGFCAASVPV